MRLRLPKASPAPPRAIAPVLTDQAAEPTVVRKPHEAVSQLLLRLGLRDFFFFWGGGHPVFPGLFGLRFFGLLDPEAFGFELFQFFRFRGKVVLRSRVHPAA